MSSSPNDERLLAFLEGRLGERERLEVLEAVEGDPELRERLQSAALGLALARDEQSPVPAVGPVRGEAWRVALAVAATLAIAVPTTLLLSAGDRGPEGVEGPGPTAVASGMPVNSEPSYVIVLHGVWPDADEVGPAESQRRAEEYWAWTTELAERDVLMAAGDLRWEPGERLGPTGSPVVVAANEVSSPDYLVGMFAVRADSYDEAVALASECPHLRYGGTVSVRRVGSGFVTAPGLGDWSG